MVLCALVPAEARLLVRQEGVGVGKVRHPRRQHERQHLAEDRRDGDEAVGGGVAGVR